MSTATALTDVRQGLGSALGHNGPPERLPLEGLQLLQGCLEFAQETKRQVEADVAANGLAAVTFIDMHEPALRILGAAVLKTVPSDYSRLRWLRDLLDEERNHSEDRALHWRIRIFELLDEVGIVDAMEQCSYDEMKAFERAEWAELSDMAA